MKKLIVTSCIISCLVFLTIGCTKDSQNDIIDDQNINSAQIVTNTAQVGTWRISYFFDSDEDETSDFNGFVFTFNEDGSLSAVNGSTSVIGTWSVEDDSGNSSSDDDGNSTDDDDFNIFFPVPDTDKFDDLNDDWDIVSISSNRIELTDVSGGNGGIDFLTFEKI